MKSSFSGNDGCVDVERVTVKSSFSAQGNCVEVERTKLLNQEQWFIVTDTKSPGEGGLSFNRTEWDAFIKGVKNGEFDVE